MRRGCVGVLLLSGCVGQPADPPADPGGATTAVTSSDTGNTTAPGTTSGNDSNGNPDSSDGNNGSSSTGGTGPGSGERCLLPDALVVDCEDEWYADGECDPVNNVESCTWDGGDCCPSTCVGGEFACGSYGFDCRDPQQGGYGSEAPELIGDPCADIADPFDVAALEAELELLSDDALGGRRPGFRADAVVQRYVEERFACLDLQTLEDGCYTQAFANDDGDRTANIVGVLPGSDPDVADEVIVVGAHHDHLGHIDDMIHNGANDNVSGLVALFAIAQAVQGDAPRRTIVFIAFGSEETGLEGSNFYVQNPPAGLSIDDVVYMINLDMLGTYDVVNSVDAFGTFEDTPGRVILDGVLEDYPELDVNRGIASPEGDSDYDPFCGEGVPYVYFETFDPPCWHEPCDDVPRMDLPHMADLARIKYEIVRELANTATDLAAAREEFGCPREPLAASLPAKGHAAVSFITHAKQRSPTLHRVKQRALHRATHGHGNGHDES